MKTEVSGDILLSDFEPPLENFGAEFRAGMKRSPKTVPARFFYDARGSQIFDRICELDEYYPTRTENSILSANIPEIAARCGRRAMLVELGSGSSSKTRLLLDHLQAPAAYVPIDISRSHLLQAAEALSSEFWPLEILPVCADYNQPITLPQPGASVEKTVIFFPGSTIGNFTPPEAAAFLRRIARWCKPGDGLLIGVDLRKDRAILERAYNDARGVTAAFNLNLLQRANRELGAGFAIHRFSHHAIWDGARGRIEMRLISRGDQRVSVGGDTVSFRNGEYIVTEYSYKYRPEGFRQLASSAGWKPVRTWTDPRGWFSVHYLSLTGRPGS